MADRPRVTTAVRLRVGRNYVVHSSRFIPGVVRLTASALARPEPVEGRAGWLVVRQAHHERMSKYLARTRLA